MDALSDSDIRPPTCAYTGELLSIERIEGTPLWRCTGGFDPSEWISGAGYDELKRLLLRRENGSTARKLRCPYKGTEIRLIEHLGMVRADGAFSPAACVWTSRQEALWEVSWRNGKPPGFPKEIRITGGEVRMPVSNPAEGIGETAGQVAERVREIMQ